MKQKKTTRRGLFLSPEIYRELKRKADFYHSLANNPENLGHSNSAVFVAQCNDMAAEFESLLGQIDRDNGLSASTHAGYVGQ